MTQPHSSPAKTGISLLLDLESRARQAASEAALTFVFANETMELIPYRQALLWNSSSGKIQEVSGTPEHDANAPFIRWAAKLLRKMAGTTMQPVEVVPNTFPKALAQEWNQWLPSHVLWVPLVYPVQQELGGLLFARDEPWNDDEKALLGFLSGAYAHAWFALRGKRTTTHGKAWAMPRKRVLALIAILLLALMFLPVRMTALGQAEVVPRKPAVLRSPLDGVVDEVVVEPNAVVKKGQLLVRLDVQALSNRLLMAEKARDVERARLLQVSQMAFEDTRYSGQLAVIKASIKEHAAEVAYIRDMLARTSIEAPMDGVAIFNDKSELEGRPVHMGERILAVTPPTDGRLVIWLSTQDAITLDPGSKVLFFLNTNPDSPIAAELSRAAFTASPRPEGFMAYRLEAEFDKNAIPLRVGLRGVAKVYGEYTSLGYYLLRRPLTALRQWLGV